MGLAFLKKKRNLVRAGYTLLGLVVIGAAVWYFLPPPPDPFFEIIRDCDKIVIRDGGFDCCGPIEDDPVVATITDPKEIKRFIDSIVFAKKQGEWACACCGHPGIDYYVEGELVQLTAVQHKLAIRTKVHGYDRRLTEESAKEFNRLLEKLFAAYHPKSKPGL